MWVANDYLTTFVVRVLHKNTKKNIQPAEKTESPAPWKCYIRRHLFV